MVKLLLPLLLLLPVFLPASAQRRKVMIQQIAALEVYKGYVKTGYRILDGGLKTIGSIKNGDFSLHKDFFRALGTVNPKFRKYPRIAESIDLQVKILQRCNQTMAALRQSSMLSSQEQEFVRKVLQHLLADCAMLLDELLLLLADGQLELKDDERLTRIDRICADMERKYSFAYGFSASSLKLATDRYREKQETARMQQYYGIEKE